MKLKFKLMSLSLLLFSFTVENSYSRDCKQEQKTFAKRGQNYSSSECFMWGVSSKRGNATKSCEMNNGVCENISSGAKPLGYFDIVRAYFIALLSSQN